jgi:hypothetical protein
VKPYRVAGAVSRWAKTSNRPSRKERKEQEAAKLVFFVELREMNLGGTLGQASMSA